MTAGDRPEIDGAEPLGGDPEARAAAYSTCLGYSGWTAPSHAVWSTGGSVERWACLTCLLDLRGPWH